MELYRLYSEQGLELSGDESYVGTCWDLAQADELFLASLRDLAVSVRDPQWQMVVRSCKLRLVDTIINLLFIVGKPTLASNVGRP